MRNISLVTGEIYHVYNRGVDKRNIFIDQDDVSRFLQSIRFFNSKDPIGSLYEIGFSKEQTEEKERLVDFIAYCVLPNHFHFLLKQKVDGGISEFMKRLSGGYTWYFNHKYKRNGSLFQGTFKSTNISSNEYLLYASAYVNLNDKQKLLGGLAAKDADFIRSSWEEYINPECTVSFCHDMSIVLEQFSSRADYKSFASDVLKTIQENKQKYHELDKLGG